MSEWDGFDNLNNENTEAAGESMPTEESPVAEVIVESVAAEEKPVADVVVESTPVEGIAPYNPYGGQMPPNGNQGNPYGNNPYNNQYNTPYTNQYNTPYNNQYGSQYNNNPYNGNSQYNNPYNNNNQYNNNPYNNNNQYNNNPYNNNNQYNNNLYNNNNQYNNNPYNNNNQYNNTSYGNDSYGGQIPPNGSQYNNNPYYNQYGNPPYNNSPYSPYAVPPKKNKNGLIIGIVIGIVVLFFIAVFALIYRAVAVFEQDNDRTRNDRDEYQFDYDDDDWGVNRYRREKNYDYDDWYDDYDDWYDGYDYDDWYDDYYDDDSQYYDLHDAIREDLSYSIDTGYIGYDMDNENMYIWTEFPIIQGGNVPNLDKLNDVIRSEVDSFANYFEEEYEDIAKDDFYDAYITGYVTYMDEDKMSIVFDERIYSDYYGDYIDVYLYCINIDMENGVVLENQNMLHIDDNFSVDFRERSDIQNGESYYISMMSDQEITDYFNSKDIIVFYTPMGMEIGFNYEKGWITVTYSEYKQYLKVF